ncbi:MAG: uroporphyrinogen decarboxylase family protein [Armatimonadota bacterium]
MLPRERVQAAFEHRPADRIPIYHGGWSAWAARVVLGREAYVGGGIQQWREACALWQGPEAHAEFIERSFQDALAVSLAARQDMIRPEYWRYPVKPTRRLDEHTFLYGDPEGLWEVRRFDPLSEMFQVVDKSPRPPTTIEDLERLVEQSEKELERYNPSRASFETYARAQDTRGEEYAVAGAGVGVGIPQTAEWLMAMVMRPDLVARYLDVTAACAERNAAVMADIGIRYLRGGGDFAGNSGPMYSPRAFHELVLPRLQRVSEACHKVGCYHLFASDGNLWPVADDLFGRSGVDGFYEIDRLAGMDLRLLRERFPRLTLLGGLASQTLHLGTRDDVVAQALDALESARELQGVIVGVSNYPVPGTPPENILAMLETIRDNR